MEHRHLLPDEFDLLVDGAEGFGVAPLVAHVESCPTCSAELERQRRLVTSLERLPRFTPSPLFAFHVMRDVQVFEPWYVPALDAMRRFTPRSRPVRVLLATSALVAATVLTLGTVWVVTRLDLLAFLLSIGAERARVSIAALAGTLASSTFGGVLNAVGGSRGFGGLSGMAVALTLFLLTVIAAAVWLRAVSAASHRRRS